jgi:hypothetical protein
MNLLCTASADLTGPRPSYAGNQAHVIGRAVYQSVFRGVQESNQKHNT